METLTNEHDELQENLADLATKINREIALMKEAPDYPGEEGMAAWLDLTLADAASGLIVERGMSFSDPDFNGPDFCQLIGAFPKGTAQAMAYIEQRKAKEARDGGTVSEYRL
jgi:hypothetical protein